MVGDMLRDEVLLGPDQRDPFGHLARRGVAFFSGAMEWRLLSVDLAGDNDDLRNERMLG